MHSQRHALHQLNYFQQAPVRGQLEPPDGYSRTGWRYLQCTDTPNELRVLLPPRTALIYAQLLKSEVTELAKDEDADWDRILQIRHLKDRMIRKCQRLAKGTTTRDKNTSRVMFFTVHAPPDFRLKEMERWFRDQGQDVAHEPADRPALPYCCEKCGPPKHMTKPTPSAPPQPRRTAASSSRTTAKMPERAPKRSVPTANVQYPETTYGEFASFTDPALSHLHRKRSASSLQAIPVPRRSRSQERRAAVVATRTRDTPTPPHIPPPNHSRPVSPYGSARTDSHLGRAGLTSPDPIPIPYRTRDLDELDELEDDLLDNPVLTQSPESAELEYRDREPAHEYAREQHAPAREHSPAQSNDTLVNAPNQADQVPFPTVASVLETIPERPDDLAGSSRPNLPRRRSSLKKCGSTSRLSIVSQTKSVTWAMDKDWEDQMSRYARAAAEAEAAAQDLDEVRVMYHDHVADMKAICRDIAEAVDHLPLEGEMLHRKQFAVHRQEERLLETADLVERKEMLYRDKILAVLEETKRVVQFCDKKRDQH
ncbi:hypothetical protein K474DRAFT_1655693, partial [Panus rudis PR-1116 ss-1]